MEDVDVLFKRTKTKIVERASGLKVAISTGACSSFEDYRKRCGVVSGLEDALSILEDEHTKLRDPDDPGEPD